MIAELPGTNNDNVVMAGAHLDSVQAGPGINDNGSGSAALLEVAENIAKLKPQNTLRFAWWGAEESGLIGSTAYVNGLSQAERDRIALYLNFDMVGSPNYVFMVYDGDKSGFPAPPGVPIPAGSVADRGPLRVVLHARRRAVRRRPVQRAQRLPGVHPEQHPRWRPVHRRRGRQDRGAAGHLGRHGGEQFDPCYHLACDTFTNNSDKALDVNSDSIAFAVLTYAYSTETVNGVPGKRVPGNFTIPPPQGPEGTGAGGGLGVAQPS